MTFLNVILSTFPFVVMAAPAPFLEIVCPCPSNVKGPVMLILAVPKSISAPSTYSPERLPVICDAAVTIVGDACSFGFVFETLFISAFAFILSCSTSF